MANRAYHQSRGSLDVGEVRVQGSFAPNGASAVASASYVGLGWSVARNSAGNFTITFQDDFPALISAQATLQLATTGAGQVAHFQAIDVASAKTAVLQVYDNAGVAADIAANAGNRIHFCFIMRNSTVA